ncbi:MAG: hypothetical protein ACK5U7_08195 [Bacteroidota bacterium]|jgi:hypothetical protein
MATVEIDTTVFYGAIGVMPVAIGFMFKWILTQFDAVKTKAEKDFAELKKKAEDESLECKENNKIQNKRIADLQNKLLEFSYKLGLLEGRAEGVHHAEFEVPHSP